ncbi:type II toxin-antitoxin system HicA family toxin [Lactobacillus sp. ESL0681]|uniref:type II toxin-antitoxin system HicA family toxin n=1 Tax=Lactobacillus sp. ESL0681 TaxID=2983211 RepID=UPI0023F8FA7B|nr:type II toxin-antitoxin system HicA family toxin [Lactobacillus sp. ESL0681]WEV39740.1 type II toxin-antitoxin system HicA family toxin [Lactobacillus sp. ESL0681]
MIQYTAADVLKLLKEYGFSERNITGDHHNFKDAAGHLVTVPYSSRKDSIGTGLYKAILKQIKGEV